jgi:hypothetical protein
MTSTPQYTPYISGLAFHKIAKWSLCPRYPVLLEPHNFEKDDKKGPNIKELVSINL